jgi:hypothetical protein
MARIAKPATGGRRIKAGRETQEVALPEHVLTPGPRRGRRPKTAATAEPPPSIADELSPSRNDAAQQVAAPSAETPPKARRGRKPKQPTWPAEEASLAGVEVTAAAAGGPQHTKSAAKWDRATDSVTFDWPAIEQAAAQDGPNQGMAKLLIAARAEGATSRWPF